MRWLIGPFRRLWSGAYRLWIAFWLFLVLGYFLLVPAATLIAAPFLVLGSFQAASLTFWLIFIGYQVVASVGVWRSADALTASTKGLRSLPYATPAKVLFSKLVVLALVVSTAARFTGIRSVEQLTSLFSR